MAPRLRFIIDVLPGHGSDPIGYVGGGVGAVYGFSLGLLSFPICISKFNVAAPLLASLLIRGSFSTYERAPCYPKRPPSNT